MKEEENFTKRKRYLSLFSLLYHSIDFYHCEFKISSKVSDRKPTKLILQPFWAQLTKTKTFKKIQDVIIKK